MSPRRVAEEEEVIGAEEVVGAEVAGVPLRWKEHASKPWDGGQTVGLTGMGSGGRIWVPSEIWGL